MDRSDKPPPGRRGKLLIILTLFAAAAGTLLHFEQYAVLYIASGVTLMVLVLLAAYSRLEDAAIHASEEAFMTGKSKGILPGDVMLSRGRTAAAGLRAGRHGPRPARMPGNKQERI